MSDNDKTRKDAFTVSKVDVETGETTIIIQKGILGPLANQLKSTKNQRKGASILRKLGYVLSQCGDMQYDKKNDQ